MNLAEVKIIEWENPLLFKLQDGMKKADSIIVKLDEIEDAGVITDILSREENDEILEKFKTNFISRKATQDDFFKIRENAQRRAEYVKFCQECINNLGLQMKLVGVHLSLDEQKLIFAFTAEGRIDFRELVKMLSRKFKKAIRMHQIGIRDEAKLVGHIGVCGRELCCKKFMQELASVTSEAAEVQQISHRGAERISGICGRLMCCLNFEKDGYKEMTSKLPKVGTKVKYEGKDVEVRGIHVLKQTVDLKIDEDTTLEVEVGKIRK